jgi:hypothetical protein
MSNTTKKSMSLLPTLGLAAIASMAFAATDVSAQQKSKLWLDVGASERIDYSGRLQMLSMRIAASTCNLEAGTETTISRGILAGSSDEVERILNGLQYGNARMKIVGEETNPRIVTKLNDVQGRWKPVRSDIDDYMVASAALDYRAVDAWQGPFFDVSAILVSEVAAEYSDPADLLQRDAILVDLAGRQRTRTQRMLFQACKIWKDGPAAGEVDALVETINYFDRTHDALLYGTDGGFKPAPTPQIAEAMLAMTDGWSTARETLLKVADGQRISDDEITTLYLTLNDLLIKSDGVTQLYAKYAKHSF